MALGLGCNKSVANQPTPMQYQSHTLTWTAQKRYAEPIRDVRVMCEYTHTSGYTFTGECFWNGGQEYASRFLPKYSGVWSYRTIANDTTDSGLHNRRGTITIAPANATVANALYRNGSIRTAEDPRFFAHENGTPFFWLGDTAWEITWKSRMNEVRAYISDRKRKGFTVINMVLLSHQMITAGIGVENRHKEPAFLDSAMYRLNPKYFQYADSIIQMANDSGMVVALVPLWAYMSDMHPSPYISPQLNRRQAFNLAHYMGARYAGNHIVWIVAGDEGYQTPEQVAYWGDFARILHTASGRRHLATAHPKGYTASYDYFPQTTEWLDFHMYQSSHIIGNSYPWSAGQKGAQLTPQKPLINGEPCYEDIPDRFWDITPTTNTATITRIQPYHVRRAIYESLFSGAVAGANYGVNGVWQWNTEEIPGGFLPRHRVDTAWQLIGSTQMNYLKEFMVQLPWHRMKLHTKAIYQDTVPNDPYAHVWSLLRDDDSVLVCYMPTVYPVRVEFPTLKTTYISVQTWSPATNTWSKPDTILNRNFLMVDTTLRATQSDMMILIRTVDRNYDIERKTDVRTTAEPAGGLAIPNPVTGDAVRIQLNAVWNISPIHMSVFSADGAMVYSARHATLPQELWWNLRDSNGRMVPNGMYMIHIQNERYSAQKQTLSVIVAR